MAPLTPTTSTPTAPAPTAPAPRARNAAAPLGLALLCALLATGVSHCFDFEVFERDPEEFKAVWIGCWGSPAAATALILEDAPGGEDTFALSGCFRSQASGFVTLAGEAVRQDEIELRGGNRLFVATRDDLGSSSLADDLLTVSFRGQAADPLPRCGLVPEPTCDDLMPPG